MTNSNDNQELNHEMSINKKIPGYKCMDLKVKNIILYQYGKWTIFAMYIKKKPTTNIIVVF